MQVYINDIDVKSKKVVNFVKHLRKSFYLPLEINNFVKIFEQFFCWEYGNLNLFNLKKINKS